MNDMTHYYLYIKAGVQLDEHTRFYRVGIGEGKKGLKQHAWLEAFAAEHGHLFVIWSMDAAEFATKCLASLELLQQSFISIGSDELIRSLKTGCDDPACWQAIQHRHQLLMRIDPKYYTYYQLSRR